MNRPAIIEGGMSFICNLYQDIHWIIVKKVYSSNSGELASLTVYAQQSWRVTAAQLQAEIQIS